MKKCLIILGSSRSKGNTFNAVQMILKRMRNIDFIDLAQYNITDFDYEHKNINDDFMHIVEQLYDYDLVILATPIYWYTMSASMKRFVDRLSDLLSIEKDYGRLLRQIKLAVITSYSVYPEGSDGFEPIFVNIAKYLGMKYIGCYFYYSGDNSEVFMQNRALADTFVDLIS